MDRHLNAVIGLVLAGVPAATLNGAAQQTSKPSPGVREQEPPGRDLYIPYLATPGVPREKELANVEQVRILAEMNRLTVELVRRRSNRYTAPADTAQLVKRLKQLAKKLHEAE